VVIGLLIVTGFFWVATILVVILYISSGRAYDTELAQLTAKAAELPHGIEHFTHRQAAEARDLLSKIEELPYTIVLETAELHRLWEARSEVEGLAERGTSARPRAAESAEGVASELVIRYLREAEAAFATAATECTMRSFKDLRVLAPKDPYDALTAETGKREKLATDELTLGSFASVKREAERLVDVGPHAGNGKRKMRGIEDKREERVVYHGADAVAPACN